jgi:starch synthase
MFQVASSLYSSGKLERVITSYPKFRLNEKGTPSYLIDSKPLYHLANVALMRSGFGSSETRKLFEQRNIRSLDLYTSRSIGDSNLIAMSSLACLTARIVKKRGNIFVVNRSSHHISVQKTILEELAFNWDWNELVPSQENIERELEEYELADVIVVPSKGSYDSFASQKIDITKVLINPFPLTKSDKIHLGTIRRDILFVGNVTLQKGFPTLVEALNSIDLPEVRLHVVGIYSKEFLQMLRKRGLNLDKVIFYGPQNANTLTNFYRKSDVLVLPSVHDGWGMVVNEAMVNGCIPIVSNGAGASDQIEHGTNGYVFQAGNSHELRNCILQALGNEQTRVTMIESIETSSFFHRNWDDFCRVYLDTL